MGPISASLAMMGTEQLFLARVFLGGYVMGLGKFAGPRGRLVAIGVALLSAVGFVALSHPWESGVILMALAPVGMGLFAGVAWALWRVTAASARPARDEAVTLQQPAMRQIPSGSLLERLRARWRFV